MSVRPLEIAIFSPFLFRLLRGIERFSLNLANELAGLGQNVTLFTRGGPLTSLSTPPVPAVRVVRAPAVRYYEARWDAAYFAAALLRQRFDVLNVFFAGYGEAEAVRAAHVRGNPAVNFIVDYPPTLVPHRFQEFHTTGLGAQLDRVIVKTRALEPPLAELFHRPVSILPSGIDTRTFAPSPAARQAARDALGLAPDAFVLLTVAALEARKGIQDILTALPLTRVPKLRYLVLGQGPQEAELLAQVRALNLDGVEFVGAQTDVRKYYQAADLFLLPSYGEAFPNALLEAMSMALVPLVADCPPYDEMIAPEFGIRVPLHAPEALAAHITALAEDAPRRIALGQAARTQAIAAYDWTVVAKQYLDLFRAQV